MTSTPSDTISALNYRSALFKWYFKYLLQAVSFHRVLFHCYYTSTIFLLENQCWRLFKWGRVEADMHSSVLFYCATLENPSVHPLLTLLTYTHHPLFFLMCSWWELKRSTVKRTKEKGQIVISLILCVCVCAWLRGWCSPLRVRFPHRNKTEALITSLMRLETGGGGVGLDLNCFFAARFDHWMWISKDVPYFWFYLFIWAMRGRSGCRGGGVVLLLACWVVLLPQPCSLSWIKSSLGFSRRLWALCALAFHDGILWRAVDGERHSSPL